MGYRSDVDIFLPEEEWKKLVAISESSSNEEFKELYKFFGKQDSFTFLDQKWVHMYASDLKWYESYDCITMFMETLEEIGQCVFIRIGEEIGDVEHIQFDDIGDVPSIYPVYSIEYNDSRIIQ